jgi:hypothetical protein
MPTAVSAATVARMRAINQLLAPGRPRTIAETASWMLALQAQDYTASKWVLALRTRSDLRDRDVELAIEQRQIVRSWPLRGTLHLTAVDDLGWMIELAALRPLAAAKTRQEGRALPLKTLEQAAEITREILRHGRILGRLDFLTELAQRGIDGSGQRGAHIVGYLAQTFVICLGPRIGRQHGIVLTADWLPPTPSLERDEALRQLAVRYVRGHGPVDAADLAWWAMLRKSDATRAFALAEEELERLDYDGRTVWVHRESEALDSVKTKAAGRSMSALGAFDELVLGYRDREPTLATEHFERVVPGRNGMFLRTVQHGGRIRGTWRTDHGSPTGAAVEPFDVLTADEARGFDRALAAHARFTRAD